METSDKTYKLIGSDGKPYDSSTPGKLGGHRSQKLYGQLDCWSALKALQRPTAETYKKNRVFFPDERTALAAGYRPCSKCMKAHYDMWKAGTLEAFLQAEENQ